MGSDKRTYWDFREAHRSGAMATLFLVLSVHPLFAQEKLLPVFHFNHLSTSNGLPTNDIRANVVRDREGYVWIGTVNGLARFDGYGCRNVTQS